MMFGKDKKASSDSTKLEELSIEDMEKVTGGISGGSKWYGEKLPGDTQDGNISAF